MRKTPNRLVYVSRQFGRYPEALLADCLIYAYLGLLIFGNMGVPLAIISGISLILYVRHVYKNITK